MHEGQNHVDVLSFRKRNGRVNGVVCGLEAGTRFLGLEEPIFLTLFLVCITLQSY